MKHGQLYCKLQQVAHIISANSVHCMRIYLLNSECHQLKKLKTILKNYQYYCFARITDITPKSVEELKELRAIGYNRLTIGVETGDDTALSFMNKGYMSNYILMQCKKLEEANIDYNIFYLTGIYGNGKSKVGVENTIKIFNQLQPKIIGASMLTVFETSQLFQEIQSGNWQEESEIEKLKELRLLIEKLEINTYFAVLGASNAFQFQGKLPSEKQKMLDYIDKIIDKYSEEQLKYYRDNLKSL